MRSEVDNAIDNIKSEQIEAVITAADYCKKLVKAMDSLAKEFENGKLEDTDEYAKTVLAGINWTIQVYNGTKEFLKENEILIDEDKINAAIADLGKAYKDDDDKAKAAVLKGDLKEFVSDMIEAGAKLN